jgi:hypothetical protein
MRKDGFRPPFLRQREEDCNPITVERIVMKDRHAARLGIGFNGLAYFIEL